MTVQPKGNLDKFIVMHYVCLKCGAKFLNESDIHKHLKRFHIV